MGFRSKMPRIACVYRFDPYSCNTAIVVEHEDYALPHDTLHTSLAGKVTFTPYPAEEFAQEPSPLPKDAMARVFVGQLPYQVTDMQLAWLCFTFGNGAQTYFPERIMKQDQLRGNRLPTGCVHTYCHPADLEMLMDGMHKRILIDDTGVWHAESAEEQEILSKYCQTMKSDRTQRFAGRPYDTVVTQRATSTYVPPPPAYDHFIQGPANIRNSPPPAY